MSRRVTVFVLLACLVACSDRGGVPTAPDARRTAPSSTQVTDAVFQWNALATQTVGRMNTPAPLPPMPESRIYAMTFAAIHDALNTIHPRYERYSFAGTATGSESEAASVGAAAATVLLAVATAVANDPMFPDPAPLAFITQAYADFLAGVPDGPDKVAGIALGTASGNAVLALRAADGSAVPGLSFWASAGTPGTYRPTPPFAFAPDNLTGLVGAATWGAVTPFVIAGAADFRAAPPYGTADPALAVTTARYTADYQEIKRLGGVVSERTPEQTAIAFFWMENSPLGWNRIARIVAADRRLEAWDAARLFALMQFAEADAYIVSLETKYHYLLWRPITAIRFAAGDGNPDTDADPAWDVASSVLGIPTPPVPDYSSAHATAGGAGAEILKAVFNSQAMPFTMESSSLPGQPRRFAKPDQAAEENAVSRIYIGYHFRHAVEAGLAQGRAVGRYVASHALEALR